MKPDRKREEVLRTIKDKERDGNESRKQRKKVETAK